MVACPNCHGTLAVPASGGEDPADVDNGYVRCPTCAPHAPAVVVRIRLNDKFVFVGEMDAGGEDALEIQINGRSIVGLRGDGSVITWNSDGEADTTYPEGWIAT